MAWPDAFTMRKALGSFAFAVFCSAAVADAPEDAVRQYLSDLQVRGLAAAPAHIHSDELARFKSMLLPMFEPGAGARHKELVTAFFGPSATPETVQGASAVEFMQAFLAVAGRQMGQAGVRFGASEVLGSVPEGDVAHVVTRIRVGAGDLAVTQMDVVSVKKEGERWRLMLTGRLEGMAQALRAQAQKKP